MVSMLTQAQADTDVCIVGNSLGQFIPVIGKGKALTIQTTISSCIIEPNPRVFCIFAKLIPVVMNATPTEGNRLVLGPVSPCTGVGSVMTKTIRRVRENDVVILLVKMVMQNCTRASFNRYLGISAICVQSWCGKPEFVAALQRNKLESCSV